MDITIVGAGRIGGNIARRLGRAGHSLMLTFARDTAAQQALAEEVVRASPRPPRRSTAPRRW